MGKIPINSLGDQNSEALLFQITHIPIPSLDHHPNCEAMSGAAAWGPSEASSWLTRPLGHWEAQLMVAWPPGVPGPSR